MERGTPRLKLFLPSATVKRENPGLNFFLLSTADGQRVKADLFAVSRVCLPNLAVDGSVNATTIGTTTMSVASIAGLAGDLVPET